MQSCKTSLRQSFRPSPPTATKDLETNYWSAGRKVYGYTLQGRGISNGPDQSAVAKFKQFIDILMRNDIGAPDLSIMSGDHQICSIEWGMNLVAFKKCTAAEMASSPKVQPRTFDEAILTEWVQQATATNPNASQFPTVRTQQGLQECQCPGCPASGATKAPNVLEAMANTGTDKGPSRHQYQRYYDKWLAPFQFKQGLKLVEIGAERGRSLHMWSKYFQNASLIAGLAYGDMTEHVEESSQAWDKVAVYWGDQSKQETMQLLADKGP